MFQVWLWAVATELHILSGAPGSAAWFFQVFRVTTGWMHPCVAIKQLVLTLWPSYRLEESCHMGWWTSVITSKLLKKYCLRYSKGDSFLYTVYKISLFIFRHYLSLPTLFIKIFNFLCYSLNMDSNSKLWFILNQASTL